jgi:hypothetical protein
VGPSVILDKSALEALSLDEAVWLDALLSANVVPVFYVEVLADLEKQGRQGQAPEAVVSRLAEKTPSNAYPNVDYRRMVLAEIAGHRIDMTTHRPMISGGDVKQASDGTIGLHVDEFPEQTALLRWQAHDFEAVERLAAKQWRDALAAQNLDQVVELVTPILPAERRISDLEQLKAFVDEYCERRDNRVISLAMTLLGVPDQDARAFRRRWEKDFRRPLDRFAPYTLHVFKVDLLFYLGIARGFISAERASNRADIAYLYYLPFAAAFVSGDRLHRRTAPLFLDDTQGFLDAQELKAALREFDEHYDKLPEDIKALGVLSFASYPPSTVHNAVTGLWDKSMRPDWREVAAERESTLGAPRDREAERRSVDELNARIAEAVVVDEAANAGRETDYAVLSHRVPATKGKWRMVSANVLDPDR